MKNAPVRQWLIFRDIIRAASAIQLRKNHTVITRKGTAGLKPPYILLCNHNAFFDFFVASAAIYPARANFVVAIDGFTMPMGKDGFISREGLMRRTGCIMKRKFTKDVVLVRQLKQVVENGDVPVIYPEARYSLCGTTAVLPESLGKFCKMLKVPVVTLICHGHHVNSPFWRLGDQKIPTEAELTLLLTAEEAASLPVEEINRRINEAFQYDDFRWQLEKGIEITDAKRAEGLHKVLYQCPVCGREYRMTSSGTVLRCEACGAEWQMDAMGRLSGGPKTELTGEGGYIHIPDWYEWERRNVRREVENGTYHFEGPVHVKSLPDSKGYIDIGRGTMRHDENGFHVEVDGKYGHLTMDRAVPDLYSCHIEYEYLGKYGDCVDLNTLTDTWYVYPEGKDFAVTKFALATEELYQHYKKHKP